MLEPTLALHLACPLLCKLFAFESVSLRAGRAPITPAVLNKIPADQRAVRHPGVWVQAPVSVPTGPSRLEVDAGRGVVRARLVGEWAGRRGSRAVSSEEPRTDRQFVRVVDVRTGKRVIAST